MPSGSEYIRRVRSEITEVDPAEVHELLHEGVAIVDVRETDEFAAGHLPGAKHVPRGYLESRIDLAVPDRSQRVILYCASGQPLGAGRKDAARRARLRPASSR